MTHTSEREILSEDQIKKIARDHLVNLFWSMPNDVKVSEFIHMTYGFARAIEAAIAEQDTHKANTCARCCKSDAAETPLFVINCDEGFPMKFSIDFPVSLHFGDANTDGYSGPRVSDPGIIYINADNGEMNLVGRTTLTAMIDDFLYGMESEGLIASDHIPAAEKLLGVFEAATKKLQAIIIKSKFVPAKNL